jgi:crossover junction endodeoxyribonuclease RusA
MIALPWPDSRLSSNARVHHMTRHRLTRSARITAGWAAKAAPQPCFPDRGDIALRITFYPPSRRGDRLNYPHLVKAYCDGLAEAWGVNDKRFAPQYVYAEPVKGGAVHVQVMP